MDASVGLKWVLRGETWQQKARLLLRDSLAARYTLIAPPLFAYETESVIQYRWHNGLLTTEEADAAVTRLSALGVRLETHPAMVTRAREIARQFQQERIYDSLYAALAELRGCEFWTADRRFYEAVSASLPHVRHLPDYR